MPAPHSCVGGYICEADGHEEWIEYLMSTPPKDWRNPALGWEELPESSPVGNSGELAEWYAAQNFDQTISVNSLLKMIEDLAIGRTNSRNIETRYREGYDDALSAMRRAILDKADE